VSKLDPVKVEINESQFPVINLESKPLGTWINEEVLLPRSIEINEDFLLIFENDLRVDEELIKVFSLSEEKILGYYGRSGGGPGEIQGGLQVVPVYGLDNQIRFLDYIRNRISVLEIEEILEGKHFKEPQLYKVLPPEFTQMQYGTILNDSLIVGGGSIRKGKLLFGNIKTNDFKLTEFIPESDHATHRPSTPNMYLTNMAVNNNKERVVVSNLYFNQIEIYDYKGVLDMLITGDDSNQKFKYTPQEWYSRNTVEYYRMVVTTDEYIMVTYYNKTDEELRYENGDFRENINSSIRVFDWDGEPIVQYDLDQRVSKFAFDESNSRIIAIAPDNLDSIIAYPVDL
jgi:hypothetical protein